MEDIRGFFDHVDHGWLVRMLEQRIADRSLIRLIVKWLKAGVLEEGSRVLHPAIGTPQGGVISPILANIYLHHVQDEWIKKVRCRKFTEWLVVLRRKLRGYWNYYGVIGNSAMTSKYYWAVNRLLSKWLNRRSQSRSMTWSSFLGRLPGWDIPPPRVVETPLTAGLH